MIARIRLVLASLAFALVVLLLVPIQFVLVKAGLGLRRKLPLLFHRSMLRILGVRVHVHGVPAQGRPLLLAANHSSWSDIVVLASLFEMSFIAKAEVAQWPLFGLLSKLQDTVFVERNRPGKTRAQASEIARRLAAGDVMVLFAEGTTSDGNRILPFKSSLFGAAQFATKETEAKQVVIQPVAIAYTRVHGIPMGRFHRPIIAWPGDVELGPSLLGMLREGAFDVDVRFGEPVIIDEASDRKALTRVMEDRVRRMMQTSLMGREFGEADDEGNSAILKPAKNR
ncbi:lysophospholipid acyltransferase family protein [Phyllobacterium sp. 0TCS1.6C]|uniref:lysophospholipid acyltransferase family protein n=1 Tax=unclassified Phyllobacterium TaxID=2638441 RepID=UPI0022648681|nr:MULTISPECIES: lysophospholipid acyltransferase family protein [unclassified Phyllobacterium]MCX8281813.1 lysophospholipid acyltransferase family protein [Phyllobacterium sp. 0TCS1.6C]MCX8295348.1 lysophospholipid acyltransferase family protein [Phyllobacterium sp. 0TCS1.6A]